METTAGELKKGYLISHDTAIASMTGLRAWNNKLEQDKKKYPNDLTYLQSIEHFQKVVKTAYEELQELTGIKTHLELKI